MSKKKKGEEYLANAECNAYVAVFTIIYLSVCHGYRMRNECTGHSMRIFALWHELTKENAISLLSIALAIAFMKILSKINHFTGWQPAQHDDF